LLFAPRRHLRRILMIAVIASVTYKVGLALSGAAYGAIFRPITGSVDSLALGALVAVLRNEQPTGGRSVVPGWLVGGAFVMLASVTAYRMSNQIDSVYTGVLAFAVIQFFVVTVASAVAIAYVIDKGSSTATALSHVLLRGVARISYGLYLYHFFMPYLLDAAQQRGWLALGSEVERSAAALILTFATATASWFVVEAPILRLKRYVPYRGAGSPDIPGDRQRPREKDAPVLSNGGVSQP
jgi:peptidoglycan/LPS O-acetylase OafA/YrhL